MNKFNKKIGSGSFSLLLWIIGMIFAFKNNGYLGDSILKFIGTNPWSNGVHYTKFYSLIFFIPSVILGFKFKTNLGAKLGRVLSLIMIILIMLLNPATIIKS